MNEFFDILKYSMFWDFKSFIFHFYCYYFRTKNCTKQLHAKSCIFFLSLTTKVSNIFIKKDVDIQFLIESFSESLKNKLIKIYFLSRIRINSFLQGNFLKDFSDFLLGDFKSLNEDFVISLVSSKIWRNYEILPLKLFTPRNEDNI